MKLGQIAHLDHDATNADFDNLALLCFEHHDACDGSTALSKGLQVGEVKFYRDELCRFMAQWTAAAVIVGETSMEGDPIAGQYIRLGLNDSAEISVTRVADGGSAYQVSGVALSGTRRAAPRIGTLDFVAGLSGDRLEHREVFSGDLFKVTLRFSSDGLHLDEDGRNPNAGMNVRFSGDYKRHRPPPAN